MSIKVLSNDEVIKQVVEAIKKSGKFLSKTDAAQSLGIGRGQIDRAFGTKEMYEKHLKAMFNFDKNGKLVSTETKINPDDISIEYYKSENSKLYKELNALRKENQRLTVHSEFEDSIITAIQAMLPAIELPVPNSKKAIVPPSSSKELLAVWSDFHAGETVNKEEMADINEFNSYILTKRFQYMIDYIIHKKQKYANINTINVSILGDIVSGTIHEELEKTNDMSIIESVFGIAAVLAQGLTELAQEFAVVKAFGVPGNHGRLKKKPYAKQKYLNWDWVVYNIVKLLVRNIENIEFECPKSIFVIKPILGDNYLFLHGDNIRSSLGIPLYGIKRTGAQLADVLASKKIIFKNIFLGHFHTTGQLDKANGEIIVNGSLKGADEFSLGNLFTSSDAKQWLFCVEEGKGTTWRDPIMLGGVENNISDKDLRYNINVV